MKIIYNKIIPFKGYTAINLLSIIFIRKEYKEIFSKNRFLYNKTINHEKIHTAQQKELLYIFFYLLYFIYYLIGLIKNLSFEKAYFSNPFEVEAYENEHNLFYLGTRKKFQWCKSRVD